ncbi:MAG: hypothetical protein ACT4QC_17730 [Planctomycetaceae bacterium]
MDSLTTYLGTPQGLIVLIGVTFATGWALFSADNRVEERRRRAADVARKLSELGFKKLPLIFTDYSIGDYSGMLRGVHELHDILADPAQRQAELETVFELLIREKLRDPDKLKVLQKLVETAQQAFASGDPLKSSPELAKQLMDVVKSGAIGGRLMTLHDSPLVPSLPNLNLLEKLAARLFAKEDSPVAAPQATAT